MDSSEPCSEGENSCRKTRTMRKRLRELNLSKAPLVEKYDGFRSLIGQPGIRDAFELDVASDRQFAKAMRAVTVERVNHEERIVVVRQAPGGVKPSWGGYIPSMLGFELCQRVKKLLVEEVEYPYVDAATAQQLQIHRDDLGRLLRRPGAALQIEPGVARWWTFAGGRVNHTLKYGFEIKEGWKVVADNFLLRIEGDGIGHESVGAAIGRMSEPGFWTTPEFRKALLGRLPNYRLSKFQDCLPEELALETVERYLLDVEGAVEWLGLERRN